eukprot:gene22861-29038_t
MTLLGGVYGTSFNPDELWVAFVEKAFAKAMGSYEGIPNIKVQKALLHLTGGSVQQINLREDVARYDMVSESHAWLEFRRKLEKDAIVIMVPSDKKMDTVGDTVAQVDTAALIEGNVDNRHSAHDNCFVPNKLYSVILCRDIGGYELVLMHNPWRDPGYAWNGEWSDLSNDWDLYPELLLEVERDPAIPWRRNNPNGYFWMAYRTMLKFFNTTYYCKLFPNEKYNFYCIRGECRGRQAGGPLTTIRDRDTVMRDAAVSKSHAAQKATAAVVIDGDSSWFNNPQYRLNCISGPTTVYVSVVPVDSSEEGDHHHHHQQHDFGNTMFVTVTSSSRAPDKPLFLWDVTSFDVVASDKAEHAPVRVKGQETSLWELQLDSKHYYHIVPNAMRRGVACDFILRVFSSKPILLESVPAVQVSTVSGEWRKVGDLDTTGGALRLLHAADNTHRENPKWCQNPQFHLSVVDQFSKDEVYLKVVLRRTDNKTTRGAGGLKQGGPNSNAADQKKLDATVGLVICKAEQLEEPNASKIKKRQPRQNKLGELIPTKESSLKKKDSDRFRDEEEYDPSKNVLDAPKTILRKLTVDPHSYHLVTHHINKNESCVFYPKIPRSWIPNGLLIVPCLSEKGVKGAFDLEVYSSEPVHLNQLPETFSRTIAGEWTETSAGGSHISPNGTWKKNPKYDLKFHYPVNSEEPARVRVSLARHGTTWKAMSRKDTVGCMLGFYIFINRNGDLQQIYEGTFVPDAELSTDPSFTLRQLSHGEVYTIMPATFSEGKIGVDLVDTLTRSGSSRSAATFVDMFRGQLTAGEYEAIKRMPSDCDKYTLFFVVWSLKEAFIKAIGSGLGFDLTQVDFEVHFPESAVENESNPDQQCLVSQSFRGHATARIFGQRRDDWRFEFSGLDGRHILTVARGPVCDAISSYQQAAGWTQSPTKRDAQSKQHQQLLSRAIVESQCKTVHELLPLGFAHPSHSPMCISEVFHKIAMSAVVSSEPHCGSSSEECKSGISPSMPSPMSSPNASSSPCSSSRAVVVQC